MLKKWTLSFVMTAVAALALPGTAQAQPAGPGPSASAAAQALMNVFQRISIEHVENRDLVFSDAYQGSASEAVLPSSEQAAQFIVRGIENQAFLVTLPADGDITMETGAGGAPQELIDVTGFVSNFGATGSVGTIVGDTDLFVGATRAALANDQVVGSYVADFEVTVAYQ